MGLFDLFRRSAPQPQPEPGRDDRNRRFHFDRDRMFDLEKTAQLASLFALPREQRDAAWYESFYDTAWSASVALSQEFVGPDGFPYLRLDIPRPGPFDSQSLANVAGDCLRNGVGAAFFASPDHPPSAATSSRAGASRTQGSSFSSTCRPAPTAAWSSAASAANSPRAPPSTTWPAP